MGSNGSNGFSYFWAAHYHWDKLESHGKQWEAMDLGYCWAAHYHWDRVGKQWEPKDLVTLGGTLPLGQAREPTGSKGQQRTHWSQLL